MSGRRDPLVRAAAIVVALLLVLVGGWTNPRTTQAAYPGANGRIAFSSDRFEAGYYDIWTMAANGSDPVQLTLSPLADLDATWSPGGAFIAFTRYNSADLDDGEIWIMKADGTGLKKLTTNPADDFSPSFSPDGAKIVFASNRDGDYDLYTMKVDGSGVTRLFNTSADELFPAWATHLHIAYVTNASGALNLWRVNSGLVSEKHQITSYSPDQGGIAPAWTSDGQKIVFTHVDVAGNGDLLGAGLAIYEMSNGNITLPNESGQGWYPQASPTGETFVYGQPWEGELNDIFTFAIGDPFPTNLTNDTTADDIDPDWQPIPVFPLVDAFYSTFNNDIKWVFAEGITVGCSPERYCPDEKVTRGQMASFLARAMDLPPASQDYFTDDNGTTHEANINKIREAGITTGCGGTNYCPNAFVTREQMATFLSKALALPATGTDYFTDDETSTHEVYINRLRAAAVTFGCTATTYCPTANVTRGQMAAFLHRGFGG